MLTDILAGSLRQRRAFSSQGASLPSKGGELCGTSQLAFGIFRVSAGKEMASVAVTQPNTAKAYCA